MFNNLIESSSHRREFKRRGSFFLFTSATYLLLFVIAGVMSIYAYDARLEDQNTEIITMLSPLDVTTTQPVSTTHHTTPPRDSHRPSIAVREIAMASVNHPEIAPTTTSAKPNTNLPVPEIGPYRIGAGDFDPVQPSGPVGQGDGSGNRVNSGGPPVVEVGTPPPAPVEKPKPKVLHKSVINGEALLLPKPPYPPLAKQLRIQGTISVQVLIDEQGKVVSAKSVSGHPFLAAAAQRAAYEARFSPTLLDERPVKVSGVITYNFVLQ